MTGLPLASISLDTDDLWSYMMTSGDPRWIEYPTYLDRFIPRALDVLDELGLTITFFLVGRDAARPEHRPFFREIVRRGHEVANHSFRHEPWLHEYSATELDRELADAESAIEHATGQRPIGFRGPGYSWTPTLLEALERRGYLFDASTFPTFIGPLARWYYLRHARAMPVEELARRRVLFGGLRDGLRPNRPFQWDLGPGRRLLEIPVTTFPGIRTPFHVSYLHYLAGRSPGAALAYLRAALRACRLTGTEPSLLLHPLDLLGRDDAPELAFFPAMQLSSSEKVAFFRQALGTVQREFRLLPMGAYVRTRLQDASVPARPVPAAAQPVEAR